VSVKRGLGRGLGALLGDERPSGAVAQLRVDAIRPNPRQPRKAFAPGRLAELEQSIRELGVLVPVIVRMLSSEGETSVYELIAGERRWRAAAAAKLETIPAIVREADDRTSLEVAIVENLQREDLDALEEAMGFAHLIDEFGFTQERLAERIGKSRPAVTNALRLLSLSDDIKARLRSGELSAGHARALLALDPALREALAARIEREGLTVREIERMAEGGRLPGARKRRGSRPKSADIEAVETRLRYRLAAPVAIVASRTGGRIEIRFSGDDELDRLVETIAPEGG
jgi:ParB family chromosome partitioning protein